MDVNWAKDQWNLMNEGPNSQYPSYGTFGPVLWRLLTIHPIYFFLTQLTEAKDILSSQILIAILFFLLWALFIDVSRWIPFVSSLNLTCSNQDEEKYACLLNISHGAWPGGEGAIKGGSNPSVPVSVAIGNDQSLLTKARDNFFIYPILYLLVLVDARSFLEERDSWVGEVRRQIIRSCISLSKIKDRFHKIRRGSDGGIIMKFLFL